MLDNAASVEQVRPLLPGSAGCAVVVTSRDALAGLVAREGAVRLDLDLLPLHDAVALLRLLTGSRADDDPAAAEALARQCALLPLALRVAAEFAAGRPEASLAELAGELADEQRRLDMLDAGGDARTAVRIVFSWSYQHLDPAAARAFRLAGLHPGTDFEPRALVALTGSDLSKARKNIAALASAHLIQPAGSGRHGMHDLLRGYARELAAAHDTRDEQHEALTRLFDYYLHAVGEAADVLYPGETDPPPRAAVTVAVGPEMPSEADVRAWLDAERANLTAVVVHCAGHGWPGHAVGVGSALFRYLITGSHLAEAHTIYSNARHAARGSGDPAAEARALGALGSIEGARGRFGDAAGHYLAALEQYVQCGDRPGQAGVLYNLGVTEHYQHNYPSAANYYRRAVTAFRDANDRLHTAAALCTLSGVEIELGSHDLASRHLRHALRVFRAEKDQAREAEALTRIGDLCLRRGELTQAADFYGQSLTIYRRTGNPVGIADALRSLGIVCLRQCGFQQAIGYLRQAVALFRETGNQFGEITALRGLAEALHGAGQTTAARAELAAALRLTTETGNTYQQASVHRDLAESHHCAGEDEQARQHWQQALASYADLGAPEADEIRARLAEP